MEREAGGSMSELVDLFPGLSDVLIVAGMCGTAVLLYAAAVLVRSLK